MNKDVYIFFGGFSADRNSAADPDVKLRLRALVCSQEKTSWTGVSWGDDEVWPMAMQSRLPAGHSWSKKTERIEDKLSGHSNAFNYYTVIPQNKFLASFYQQITRCER